MKRILSVLLSCAPVAVWAVEVVPLPDAALQPSDVEVSDGLCAMRFSRRENVLYLRDAKGMDFARVGGVRFKLSPPVAKLVGAEKVSAKELRLTYSLSNTATEFDFRAKAFLTGRGLRLDFETDAPPDIKTHGAMLDIRQINGTKRKNMITGCGYWMRPAPGYPSLPGVPFEVKSCSMKPYQTATGQNFWCLNCGWSGLSSECVALGGKKGEAVRRGSFEFVTGFAGDDPHLVAAWRDGRPFVLRMMTPKKYNLWECGQPEFTISLDPLVTGRRTLRTRVWDFDGVLAVDESREIEVETGMQSRYTHVLPTLEGGRGIYFAECSVLSNGVEECFIRTNLGVLPPHEFKFREKSKAGMAAYPGEESAFELMKRLGVHYIRSGNNKAVNEKYGFTAYAASHSMGVMFDPTNSRHKKVLESIVARQKESGCPQFEYGNEVGWHATEEEQRRLIKCYKSWLVEIRRRFDEEGMKDVKIFSFGIQPDYSAFMMGVMKDEGVFDILDGLNLHPGRGCYTADNIHGGWVYRGIIQRARRRFTELGYPDKDIHMTECYACANPNDSWHDSPRQATENTVLNLVIAEVEPKVVDMMHYKLHQGLSNSYRAYPEPNASKTGVCSAEFEFGLLHRDDSPKPSLFAYAATCEELDGATFVRELTEGRDQKLKVFEFSTPRGILDIVYDRSEGYRENAYFNRMVPKEHRKGTFRHLEAWQRHWSVRKTYKFKTTAKEVTLIDIIGRRTKVKSIDGYVTIELDGEPMMVYGLDLSREFAEAQKLHSEIYQTSFDDKVDYVLEKKAVSSL